MTFRFTSRASTELVEPITASSSTIRVTGGTGGRFPVLQEGEKFAAVLTDETAASEIVTAISRSDDFITISRGQEGTAAQTWRAGTRFELRLTSMVLESFIQRSGDTMRGNLDLNGNRLLNAVIAEVETDKVSSPRYRNEANTATNELILPNEAARYATIGRRAVLLANMFANVVFPYRGSAETMPAWFMLCDGQNGTPDLRGRFIIGVNPQTPLNATGGSASRVTEPGGALAAGTTGGTVLTNANLPSNTYVNEIDAQGVSGAGDEFLEAGNDFGYKKSTGTGTAHTHPTAAVPGHTHAYITLPPYYALAYVMFKSEFLGLQ